MAEQPAIDPRYDPAFQRGYDGSRAAQRADAALASHAPRVASALEHAEPTRSADNRSADHRRAEHRRDDHHAAVPVPSPAADTRGGQPAGLDPASAPVVIHAAGSPARAPWTNPFAIAVTGLGVLAVVAGFWMFDRVEISLGVIEAADELDYWTVQMFIIASPIAVSLGAAILAGVLFLCAGYWAKRPRTGATD